MKPSIDAHIDNQALINLLSYGPDTAIKYVHLTDSYLIREIHAVLDTLPVSINCGHVKLHQFDNIKDPEEIPILNLVNNACDISADLAHHCHQCKEPSLSFFPSTTATVMHRTFPLHSFVQKHFLFTQHDSQIKARIQKKENWSDEHFNSIAWDYYRMALYQTTHKSRHHSTRITHSLWPTNTLLARRSKCGALSATVSNLKTGTTCFDALQIQLTPVKKNFLQQSRQNFLF
mmetsp:Transcript_23519/g.35719  ORF Transcript_23519/g.35719 Transcript_23519/m.35719 type:complete len:232 (-) Transcript_23519:224-919(-)